MPPFQAKRTIRDTGNEESAYIEAADRQQAIAALRQKGWASAERLDVIPRGIDLPEGAEIIHAAAVVRGRPRPRIGLAESGLVRRPIFTIAAGVGLGIVVGFVVLWILGWLLALLGIAVFAAADR